MICMPVTGLGKTRDIAFNSVVFQIVFIQTFPWANSMVSALSLNPGR
jgi:hypothetical protein